jgi:HEAT repeat protein
MSEQFLADIKSDDEDVRYKAWAMAEQMEPGVIPELSSLLAGKDPGVRRAADEALKNIVHSVGKDIDAAAMAANAGRPDDPGTKNRRQGIVDQLLSLLDGKRDQTEKAMALRHLSLIATADDVPMISKGVGDEELREEVVFCLERIPGKTAEQALLSALPAATDDFKPRILAALGHRRADEAIPACLDAMKSSDTTIAVAAMKAVGRIGGRVGGEVPWPSDEALSDWQKVEYTDSLLRFADGQVERGAPDQAWPIYEQMLDREEEHLQCAAIIGLAKINTAQAAAAIFPKLSSNDHKVRITAQKAWEAMSGGESV